MMFYSHRAHMCIWKPAKKFKYQGIDLYVIECIYCGQTRTALPGWEKNKIYDGRTTDTLEAGY